VPRRVILAAAVALAGLLALPPGGPGPAGAQTPAALFAFPGLEHQRITFRLPDGNPAVGHVLRFDPADPMLELRPVLGRDSVPGLETVVAMNQRSLGQGGVAGINAGFWLNNPPGDPNGYLAIDGRLVSDSETQGAGPRGTYGLGTDGRVIMDRLDTEITMTVNGENSHRVTAMNRHYRAAPPPEDDDAPQPEGGDGSEPVFIYDHRFGGVVSPRDDAPRPIRALIVPDLQVAPTGVAEGTVVQVLDAEGGAPIPSTGSTILVHGAAAFRLGTVLAGDRVTINVSPRTRWTLPEQWEDIRSGLAAGPLILKDGVPIDPASWENEGFAPVTHSGVRHPRSAIARTQDGKVLLVTIDGRQPGRSHGMTMHELSHYLRTELGAVEAISLDGGGSTQMSIDGVLRNRPCCDTNLRPVATGLLVFHNYTFTATERIAGAGREGTAALAARASHPSDAGEVILAAGGNFPDALAGGPLASTQDAPLLLTASERLSQATRDELARLQPRLVTILGGTGVVSETVEAELVRSGYLVRRVAGRDRTETAAAIARLVAPQHQRAVLAYQGDFPDALSAAPPAGMLRMPILLTATGRLPQATRQALVIGGVREVLVVGGVGRVSQAVEAELRGMGIAVTRLAGTTRYATAQAVNEWAHANVADLDPAELIVATGARFPDALAGGPLAAKRRQLLMILPSHDVYGEASAASYLRSRGERGLTGVTLLGGHGVIGSYQQWQLDQLALQ
jgi:putative cell wall-binding protein